MRVKVQKWGNSLAVRIPRSVAIERQIEVDGIMEMSLTDEGILLRPITRPKYTLDDLLSGVTEENLHGEIDLGPPVGEELC